MKNVFIISCIVLIMTSCNLGAGKKGDETSSAATSAAYSDNAMPPILYKGAMSIAHEAEYFVDCETKEVWAIDFDEETELQKSYNDIVEESSNPFQEIYAEIKGYLEDAPEQGFASESDKLLRIVEVVHLNSLDRGNDCSRSSNDVN